jgi:hypothetical protein
MCFLFVGAMKLLRNPPSHRHVPLDAKEAARIIVLASELLSIVDAREPEPLEDGPAGGGTPIIGYGLGYTRRVFVLDVRVGNRGHKPWFLSEIWLCAPKRSQARCVFREHSNPPQIASNSGKVYTLEIAYADTEPYRKQGAFIEVTDATGRKFTRKLNKKSTEFLAVDFESEFGLLGDEPAEPDF